MTGLIVTELGSASFRLVLHAQHIFANSFNFLVTWGLAVTVFHSIPRAYFVYTAWRGTVLANTAVLCMRVRVVCLPVRGATAECYYNTLLRCKGYFSSLSVVSRAFSALCMYSTFRHHPHPLGYVCAKFLFFCGLHCWASPWRKIVYSIALSPSLSDVPGTPKLALRNMYCTSHRKCLANETLTKRQENVRRGITFSRSERYGE